MRNGIIGFSIGILIFLAFSISFDIGYKKFLKDQHIKLAQKEIAQEFQARNKSIDDNQQEYQVEVNRRASFFEASSSFYIGSITSLIIFLCSIFIPISFISFGGTLSALCIFIREIMISWSMFNDITKLIAIMIALGIALAAGMYIAARSKKYS